MKISYAKTVYGQDEIDAVVSCLNNSTQMGEKARSFESKIAKLFDKKHCLYVNSGSSALYIGVEALDLPKNSEVITPALTFSTSIGCLVKNGLKPIFVDVEENTFNIDVDLIESKINENTSAILAPNLMGNLCDWPKIRKIADKYNLCVIEDSADTLGATIDGKSSGAWTDMSITSFYGSHIINCAGNGGALCLNSDLAMQNAKLLRSWGRSSSLFDEKSESIENRFNIDLQGIEYDAKFVFEKIGYNLEGSEIGAAFGLVQLNNLDKNILQRQKNFDRQTAFFNCHNDFFEVPIELSKANTAWLAYPIVLKENTPFSRRDFQIFLENKGIQTRVVFTGNVLRQPMMSSYAKDQNPDEFVNADRVMKNGVLLPVHHGLTDEMFEYFENTVLEFIHKYK